MALVIGAVAAAPTGLAADRPADKAAATVLVSAEQTDVCLADPDTLRFAWRFVGKVTGSPKPKKVKVKYDVKDVDTGDVAVRQALNLRKPRYKKTGRMVNYQAGSTYRLHGILTFKVPGSSKTIRDEHTYDPFTIDSAADLAQQGLPPCS